jgi:hypothetical protein
MSQLNIDLRADIVLLLDEIGKEIVPLTAFDEKHDLSIPMDQKAFKKAQTARISGLVAVDKKLGRAAARIKGCSSGADWSDLEQLHEALVIVSTNAASLSRLMHVDSTTVEKLDPVIQALELRDVQLSAPYKIRQFKTHLNKARAYNDFEKVADLAKADGDWCGPDGILAKLMSKHDIEELVVTHIENTHEALIQPLTEKDITKGGSAMLRLSSFLTALLLAAPDMLLPPEFEGTVSTWKAIVCCEQSQIQEALVRVL